MASAVVEVRKLHKAFGEFEAVRDLSFDVQQGEILGLLGVNGAGKTTVMSILLGLISPSSGSIRIFGLEMPRSRVAVLKRANFCSPYTALPSNLSVLQNLTVFAQLYRVGKARERIDELLDLFEIASLRHRVTGALSSGESARVNLCKALLNRPELLLMDEPMASLDPDIAERVRTILKQVQQMTGMAILYTSHNMQDAHQVCDRLIFLHQGRILCEGTPDDVLRQFSEQSLEQVFIRVARSGDMESFAGEAGLRH